MGESTHFLGQRISDNDKITIGIERFQIALIRLIFHHPQDRVGVLGSQRAAGSKGVLDLGPGQSGDGVIGLHVSGAQMFVWFRNGTGCADAFEIIKDEFCGRIGDGIAVLLGGGDQAAHNRERIVSPGDEVSRLVQPIGIGEGMVAGGR